MNFLQQDTEAHLSNVNVGDQVFLHDRSTLDDYTLNSENVSFIVTETDVNYINVTDGDTKYRILYSDVKKITTSRSYTPTDRSISSVEDVDLFGGKHFEYELSTLYERDDQRLITLFVTNIIKLYPLAITEIELRAFQNEAEYGGFSNTLNIFQFNKLTKFFEKSPHFNTKSTEDTLDILPTASPSLRFSARGRDAIYKYCMSNKISHIETDGIYKAALKSRAYDPGGDLERTYSRHFASKGNKTQRDFTRAALRLYATRAKLGGKIEIPLECADNGYWAPKPVANPPTVLPASNNSILTEHMRAATRELKLYNVRSKHSDTMECTYRLKSRKSFMYNTFIRIDLTTVRASKENSRGYMPTKKFIDADLANQDKSYEFEIEIVNTEDIDFDSEFYTKLLSTALNIIKYASSIINDRSGFTHTSIRDEVLEVYYKTCRSVLGVGQKLFLSPKVSGFKRESLRSITEHTYCVTDKADGLGNLMIIYHDAEKPALNGYIFYVSSNMEVFHTHMKIADIGGVYICNGEYVAYTSAHTRKDRPEYLIYDAYVYNNTNISTKPLLYESSAAPVLAADQDSNPPPLSRVDYIHRIVKLMEGATRSGGPPASIGWTSAVNQAKTFICETGSKSIGEAANEIWSRRSDFDYKLDGIIYTPMNVPVGYSPSTRRGSFGRTWHLNLKWKPLEETTVDVLISLKRNPRTGKPLITPSADGVEYRRFDLFVGGINNTRQKWRPPQRKIGGEIVLSDDDFHAEFSVTDNNIYDDAGDIVMDDTVVELSYDPSDSFNPQSFTILRTRHDKTFKYRLFRNYQKKAFLGGHTDCRCAKDVPLRKTSAPRGFKPNFGNFVGIANKVWTEILNPISIDELIASTPAKYFAAVSPKIRNLTSRLRKRHNEIKEEIIKEAARLSRRSRRKGADEVLLLDLSVGKGADMLKWQNAGITHVLGIDKFKTNLTDSSDGALVRLAKFKRRTRTKLEYRFVQGDTSESIKDNTNIVKEMFKQIDGTPMKYNIIASMFSLHYYFIDEETLTGFIRNIVDNIAPGGYFIGMCYNGKRIFNSLTSAGKIVMKNNAGARLVQIDRAYESATFADDVTSLGLKIKAWVSSIGIEHDEYLVNFTYLIKILSAKGFEVVKLEDFGVYNATSTTDKAKALMRTNESDEFIHNGEVEISNYNTLFIFKKKML